MNLAARLLLDLGGVEKRGDDRCRSDSNGNARLYEFRPALFARFVVIFVGHGPLSMGIRRRLEAG